MLTAFFIIFNGLYAFYSIIELWDKMNIRYVTRFRKISPAILKSSYYQ